MGVIMSANATPGRFSPESNAALINTDDFLNGVMDSRWTIITRVTVLMQLLVHSCSVGIYPYFNEWWSTSSLKVMHVDGILFPTFVMNMAKVVFHIDNLYVDIHQYIYIYIYHILIYQKKKKRIINYFHFRTFCEYY